MLISASIRPRGIKRGVSDKKLAAALGIEPCLTKMVGRLELSANRPQEFAFLHAIYEAFHPVKNQSSKIIVEIDGKPLMSYSQARAQEKGKQ
jgi:hypothetical protein